MSLLLAGLINANQPNAQMDKFLDKVAWSTKDVQNEKKRDHAIRHAKRNWSRRLRQASKDTKLKTPPARNGIESTIVSEVKADTQTTCNTLHSVLEAHHAKELDTRVSWISKFDGFSNVEFTYIDEIVNHFHFHSVAAHTIVLNQDKVAGHTYFLIDGSVELSYSFKDPVTLYHQEVKLPPRQRGVFGDDVALLEEAAPSNPIRVQSGANGAEFLCIRNQTLKELKPQIVKKLHKQAGKRLANKCETLLGLVTKKIEHNFATLIRHKHKRAIETLSILIEETHVHKKPTISLQLKHYKAALALWSTRKNDDNPAVPPFPTEEMFIRACLFDALPKLKQMAKKAHTQKRWGRVEAATMFGLANKLKKENPDLSSDKEEDLGVLNMEHKFCHVFNPFYNGRAADILSERPNTSESPSVTNNFIRDFNHEVFGDIAYEDEAYLNPSTKQEFYYRSLKPRGPTRPKIPLNNGAATTRTRYIFHNAEKIPDDKPAFRKRVKDLSERLAETVTEEEARKKPPPRVVIVPESEVLKQRGRAGSVKDRGFLRPDPVGIYSKDKCVPKTTLERRKHADRAMVAALANPDPARYDCIAEEKIRVKQNLPGLKTRNYAPTQLNSARGRLRYAMCEDLAVKQSLSNRGQAIRFLSDKSDKLLFPSRRRHVHPHPPLASFNPPDGHMNPTFTR